MAKVDGVVDFEAFTRLVDARLADVVLIFAEVGNTREKHKFFSNIQTEKLSQIFKLSIFAIPNVTNQNAIQKIAIRGRRAVKR